MATAVQAPPAAEQRLLLHNVSWQTYETLLKEFDGRPAVRFTYDDGDLEIMTLSHEHENLGTLLGRFVEAISLDLDIEIHSGGSTTLKKELKKRGLEADECYWIQHEPQMRGKKEFDILTDPPPDLAIEVDITRSSLHRLAIYASLGVPEVWRFDGEKLHVYLLGADGQYAEHERSAAFPFLPLAEVLRFLRDSDTQSENQVVRSLLRWVREELLPAWEESKRKAKPRRGNGKRKPK